MIQSSTKVDDYFNKYVGSRVYAITFNNKTTSAVIQLNTTKGDAKIYISSSKFPLNYFFIISFEILINDFLNAKGDIKDIQVEKGSSPTPYEPYYILDRTTVVQESNHTLKAIWQEN